MYAKDPYEPKHQLLIKKYESVFLRHGNDFKVFIGYSNDMENISEIIDIYNPNKVFIARYCKRKVFIVFDDMIADMISNNKISK